MRQRVTGLTAAALTGLTGAVLSPAGQAPAVADEPGFSVTVDAPDEFAAGGNARDVTAVVTSQNRQCRKVRWVLVVSTTVDRDQLTVTRIEEDGEFAVRTRAQGAVTQFVDRALDPGLLCRGRTVTGRWTVGFDGPDADEVQLEVRAFDVRDRLLSSAGAVAEVVGDDSASPSTSPSPSSPSDEEEDAPAVPPAPPADEDPANSQDSAEKAALASQDSALLGPGLVVGGVFVFLGVALLLRLRFRAHQARRRAEALPTGFYSMPGSSR